MQVDVGQGVAVGFLRVFEAHVVKVDGAVLHVQHRVFRVVQGAFLVEHFHNTLGGLGGHGDHHEDHGEHHQTHKDLERVGEQRGHLAHVQVQALAGDDRVRAKGQHKHHDAVDAELHQRVVQSQNPLGLGEVLLHIFGGVVELFLLVVLPHVGFHHPHAPDVLLDGGVQVVVLAKDPAEQGHGLFRDKEQANAQHRDGHQEDQGHFAAHDKAHHKGEDEHQGAAHGGADDHHVGHLHVGDVGGQTGDQAGDRELIDVLKGIALDFVEHILSQVAGKAAAGGGTGLAGQGAEG